MRRSVTRILRWTRWIILTIILLPFVSLIFMKLTGAVKMRKPDDQIIGELNKYSLEKKIDTLQTGSHNISYLLTTKGEKKKDAVLFVHGSPGSLDAYLKYMHNDSLLQQVDLISYDRPGYGHSDFGKSLPSLRRQARVLTDFMDELDYERYWLIGHSYGAAVILQVAIDYPNKLAGMGIIAGSITYDMEPVAGWRKWVDLPFVRPLLPNALRVSNDELMELRRDLRMNDDDWNNIRVPVSLIHGTKDVLVPFENLELAKEKLVHSDSVRTVVFEDENHFILWTQTEQIVKEILTLIRLSKK